MKHYNNETDEGIRAMIKRQKENPDIDTKDSVQFKNNLETAIKEFNERSK